MANSRIHALRLDLYRRAVNELLERLTKTATMAYKESALSHRGVENIIRWVKDDTSAFRSVERVLRSHEWEPCLQLGDEVDEGSAPAAPSELEFEAVARVNELLQDLLRDVRNILCSGTLPPREESIDGSWEQILFSSERKGVLCAVELTEPAVYRKRFQLASKTIINFIDLVLEDFKIGHLYEGDHHG